MFDTGWVFDMPHPPTAGMALLAACAEAMRAARAAHNQVLAAVAALERAEVHADCGHPSTSRLLEELLRLDRGPARALVAESRLLVAPEPDALHPDADVPEPDLPATADAASEGALDPEHVGIVAATMTRLRAVGDAGADGAERSAPLPTPVLAEVERQLAALARERSPRQLAEAAGEIADRYDPDGAAPHDTDRPTEELRLNINRSGVCTGRFRFTDPATGQALIDEITARTPLPDPDELVTPLRPGPELAERRGEALRHLLDDARRTRHDDENTGDPEDVDCPDCDHSDAPADPVAEAAGNGSNGDLADLGDLGDLTDLIDLGGRLDAALDDLLADPTGSPPDGPPDGPASAPPGGPFREPADTAAGRPGSASSRRDRPSRDTTMIVTVPLELLEQRLDEPGAGLGTELGLLDGRYRLSADTARRLACDAGIVPAVLGTRGEVLDLGRRTRTVSTAQRRAVITRDRHCAFPGCRRSPKRCEVHHVIPWSWGGPTDLDHLVLLCMRHHQQIHHSPWAIIMDRGRPTFIPPTYLDPARRPRTNATHREAVVS